jgi:PAS domain S-box-containing protein
MLVIEEGEEIINKEEYNPNNGEWTLTSKVPWRDDGEIRGLIGVSRFITEKKEYESELRVRTRAMDEAPVGITVHEVADERAPMVYANERFEELTGYDASEFEAGVGDVLFGPETDPEQVQAIRDAFAGREGTATVVLLYDAEDTPFWGRVNLAPVYDDDDELTHYVGFLQDVTETKERAEEVERRLDEFGDLLADELQTPLTAAEEALASASADDESLVTAKQSVERVEKLVEDLTAVHSFSVKSRDVFDANGGEPENEQ